MEENEDVLGKCHGTRSLPLRSHRGVTVLFDILVGVSTRVRFTTLDGISYSIPNKISTLSSESVLSHHENEYLKVIDERNTKFSDLLPNNNLKKNEEDESKSERLQSVGLLSNT